VHCLCFTAAVKLFFKTNISLYQEIYLENVLCEFSTHFSCVVLTFAAELSS